MSLTVDTSFGDLGKVIEDLGYISMSILSMQIYNNKIIIAGCYYDDENYLFLARYNLNGTIDSTFGINGYVLSTYIVTYVEQSNIMIIQSTGKILVLCKSSTKYALVRYESNGDLDTSFGIGGVLETLYDFSDGNVNFITKQRLSDDFILCFLTNPGSYTRWCIQQYNDDATENGSLIETDFSFADISGTVYHFCYCNTVDYSGNIIIGGRSNAGAGSVPNPYIYAVYDNVGAFVRTVSYLGTSNGNMGYSGVDVDISNNIVFVGDHGTNILIRKYDNEGTLLYSSLDVSANNSFFGVLIDSNNKIIVSRQLQINSYLSLNITRLNTNLTIDSLYNITVSIPNIYIYINKLLYINNKLLTGGYIQDDDGNYDLIMIEFTTLTTVFNNLLQLGDFKKIKKIIKNNIKSLGSTNTIISSVEAQLINNII